MEEICRGGYQTGGSERRIGIGSKELERGHIKSNPRHGKRRTINEEEEEDAHLWAIGHERWVMTSTIASARVRNEIFAKY